MSISNVAPWYEVMRNNGDGSYSPLRFRTRKEANLYRNFCIKNDPEALDGDAEVWKVDPTCPTFFDDADTLIQDWKDLEGSMNE